MAPLELEGGTLGEKHRDYNRKLQEHIKQQTILTDKLDDDDVNNLLKIDIASHNKDVDYILNVLKSDDILCVSRAVARCKWLVTDQDYSNIINPDYLQSELFPNMTPKAIIKLKKHIRHNINDETRAENFYLNESNKADAIKWLPYCSVVFIQNNIKKHDVNSIKMRLFKRLCERSISIFEIMLENYNKRGRPAQAVTFLLNTDIDKYLDVIEKNYISHGFFLNLKLNHKATELIMKQSPKRVIDDMDKYVSILHIPTLARYLKVDEIKKFLYTEPKQNLQLYEKRIRLFQYDTLKHFIHRLPKDEQFDFAKKVCMNEGSSKITKKQILHGRINNQIYDWYQFAPFEEAFEEITKLISQNADNNQKYYLLSLLIKCAKRNLQHIQIILKYYIKNYKNENSSCKLLFVTEIITHLDVSKYDKTTWDILNELLASMNIYDGPSVISSRNKNIVHSIIIHNVLNDQTPPEIIKNIFIFDTMKLHKANLNQEQRNKIFNYLYEHLSSKLNDPVTDKDSFTKLIVTLKQTLILLKDWDKTLLDYPLVLNKIREAIKAKKENSWKESLSSLYNVNKSWRKHMFEESMDLCPSEEVCLNALKHDPKLLAHRSEEVTALMTDDSISLRRLHAKLRVYWPQSLAQQWINEYINKINETTATGQKASVVGICTMLSQKPLLDLIEKYKPEKAKIDWKHTDERVLNIQRLLAKNMHRGRPQPNPEAILSYAKGDYLQFALPSLLAILYNLNSPIARQCIPKLLDAPVSVQKHGIRFAFKRLDAEELQKVFLSCWKSFKNPTIRALIFKYTHTLLCNEKDNTNAAKLWELLEIFIDNLTFTEDKEIYKTFSEVEQVPMNVRANYIVKVYRFLQKLIPKIVESDRSQYQNIIILLTAQSRVVMETISSEFITSIIQDFIDTTFFNKQKVRHSDYLIQVISAYLLCAKTEKDQIQKYENVFVPIMRRSFEKWGEKTDIYFVKQNFDQLLTRLNRDLKDYVVEKKMIIPLKMFTLIMNELEKSLTVPENYMILTKWKLTVALAKLTQEYPSAENDDSIWYQFGKICLEYLKTDVTQHFTCIYVLFCKCVRNFDMGPQARIKFLEGMLSDNDFIPAYLCSIQIGSSFTTNEYDHIWKKVSSHPSVEVKMHYYDKVQNKLSII